MKQITESTNTSRWPRHSVKSIECRKRDLVVRVADWTRDKDEPSYDVEVYIGGIYDWNESECCTLHEHGSKVKAKAAAIAYAQKQIAKLL